MHQLQHAHGAAGAEIERLRPGVRLRVFQRLQMTLSQIDHMQIIAQAGSVGRGIVVAEYGELFQLPRGNAGNIGHEIVGNPVRILAQQAGFVRADGIEIAQQHGAEVRIRGSVIPQNLLDHDFRPAVGVGRHISRHGFHIGHRILRAVDRRGGGENQLPAAEFLHDLQKCQRGIQIIAVIGQRNPAALSHRLEARKVNHSIDGMGAENLLHGLAVADILLVENRRDTRDLLNLIHNVRLRI